MNKPWLKKYEMVCKFVQEHGRFPQNVTRNEDELKLYYWCNKQRALYKNGKLTNEYVCLLNQIKFDWRIVDYLEAKMWLDNYNALATFINKNNRMPYYKTEKRLYQWYHANIIQMDYWGPANGRLPLMQKIVDYDNNALKRVM